MEREKKHRYIFLTLTVPSVAGCELKATLDCMMSAFNRFVGYKRIETAFQGWFRSLEVTHNVDRSSPSFDTYHPHYHLVICVSDGYFNQGQYIGQAEYLKLWQRATRNPAITQVDVRIVRPNKSGSVGGAVAELAKYSVKESDFLPDDLELSRSAVEVLDIALDGRRLVAFGGKLKEIHKKLNLGEAETEDVEKLEDDNSIEVAEKVFYWCFYRKQYYLKDKIYTLPFA
jgi:plasmid rolling circle replication initiator protein Rep